MNSKPVKIVNCIVLKTKSLKKFTGHHGHEEFQNQGCEGPRITSASKSSKLSALKNLSKHPINHLLLKILY